MALLHFQPRDTPNLKGWSTSSNDMHQKRQQEICAKSDILSASNIYFEKKLVTSIALPSDWEPKHPTNSSLA